jgi:hypothetical protein
MLLAGVGAWALAVRAGALPAALLWDGAADVALYAKVDPLRTVRGLSAATNVPEGAIVRWVLARWASEGASGLLELGPTMTRRLHGVCTAAEAADSDEARMAAYHQLRQMISWLNHPLDHPEVYDL